MTLPYFAEWTRQAQRQIPLTAGGKQSRVRGTFISVCAFIWQNTAQWCHAGMSMLDKSLEISLISHGAVSSAMLPRQLTRWMQDTVTIYWIFFVRSPSARTYMNYQIWWSLMTFLTDLEMFFLKWSPHFDFSARSCGHVIILLLFWVARVVGGGMRVRAGIPGLGWATSSTTLVIVLDCSVMKRFAR